MAILTLCLVALHIFVNFDIFKWLSAMQCRSPSSDVIKIPCSKIDSSLSALGTFFYLLFY